MLAKPDRRSDPEDDAERRPVLRTIQAAAPAPAPALRPDALHARGAYAEPAAELLAATGLISPTALEAVRDRLRSGSQLVQALADEGLASSAGLARVYASRYRLPLVDLASIGVSEEACRLVPPRVLERVAAIPYLLHEGRLQVAVADPRDVHGIDELRLATPHPVELAVADREEIHVELARVFRGSDSLGLAKDEIAELADVPVESEPDEAIDASDAPLVRLVNGIIAQAAETGASDVHFEPQETGLVVRYRVDGVLHEAHRVPPRMAAGVISRLKVLAKLDIAERRKPQDGRISLSEIATGRPLDLRLATLPTIAGETAVVRLIDKSRKAPTLEELGLPLDMRTRLDALIRRPTGALLVTGPTGSGKSTTLYAALSEINRPEISILTVEDPVEYRLTGVNQVHINPRAGLTFAGALRSILRSDPDVVMVGEIRDSETAKISIEAAMTGHLVLSSMHTTDAPSAITRLTEMGVEPFLTGSAVTAVLAQRLARKLCTHCREPYVPTEEDLRAARIAPEAAAAAGFLYRRRGCAYCSRTGYRGRIGVFQLLVMNETIERLACAGADRKEIERAARAAGMQPLWHDGIQKLLAGVTSVEELARIVSG